MEMRIIGGSYGCLIGLKPVFDDILVILTMSMCTKCNFTLWNLREVYSLCKVRLNHKSDYSVLDILSIVFCSNPVV